MRMYSNVRNKSTAIFFRECLLGDHSTQRGCSFASITCDGVLHWQFLASWPLYSFCLLYLQIRKSMVKVELYQKFANYLAVSLLLSVAWIGYEVVFFVFYFYFQLFCFCFYFCPYLLNSQCYLLIISNKEFMFSEHPKVSCLWQFPCWKSHMKVQL